MMIDKTETEKWAAADAAFARLDAARNRPWGAKEYLIAFLYWALVISMSWGVIAVGAFIIYAILA